MTTYRNHLLPAFALAALSLHSWAESPPTTMTRRIDPDSGRHFVINHNDDKGEKEQVTYLGIETAPINRTLSAQLGLPKDVGLVVISVVEKSPASEVLKEDDVLTKFADQILIDTRQLSVLVRAKQEGEEVRLTFVRGGKEMTAKVKLGTRQVAKQANAFFFRNGDPGSFGTNMPMLPYAAQGTAGLPGMGPDDARDVLRMIEHERGNLVGGPGVRIMNRRGGGSTVLNLPDSNISFSTDEGGIEIKSENKQRSLTIKDASGKVTFEGPITTEEERAKLPPGVKQRLEKLDIDAIRLEFAPGENFRPEVVPLLEEQVRTKIGRSLGHDEGRPAGRALRPL